MNVSFQHEILDWLPIAPKNLPFPDLALHMCVFYTHVMFFRHTYCVRDAWREYMSCLTGILSMYSAVKIT